MTSKKANVGLIGLAVMGQNLALNMQSKGYSVVVYNRTQEKTLDFIAGRGGEAGIRGAKSREGLVSELERPRKIFMMVRAGAPVDDLIDQLLPLLTAGDILIDGGNSQFADSEARQKRLEKEGILYIGTGVSGGEEGALKGPSLMPGGSKTAWPEVKDLFQTIAAHTEDGSPCCDWVGSGGAGHFVKMVHNGIEYGDMQLIAEAYQFMRDYLRLQPEEMAACFRRWNQGPLSSYLIEITGEILAYKDESGRYLLDDILDAAGQKGTGKWTCIEALQEGVPLTLIGEAVFARCLSAQKELRSQAGQYFNKQIAAFDGDEKQKELWLEALEAALYAAKLVSYTQGYELMKAASDAHEWDLNYGGIALMWRGGCIIRSRFLDEIKAAFDRDPQLPNLLLDAYFADALKQRLASWRKVIQAAVGAALPMPAMTSALAYFDGLTCSLGSANMLQAQRDYFGAHTYERIDRERGLFYHTNWTGEGGDMASSTYSV